MMTSAPSVYDVHAPQLLRRGFSPLPIGPGTKEPQHFVPSLKKYSKIRGWNHPAKPPETSPQPDAGIGLKLGLQSDGTYVFATDWDHDGAALAAMDDPVLFSPVSKEGRRGFTSLHRSAKPVASRDFRINGVVAVQILGEGKQTVLPPSIHPDTGKPYRWVDKYSVYACSPSDLPLAPDDYIEHVENILWPLGYEPEPAGATENPAAGSGYAADARAAAGPEENPFRQLNDLAVKNLSAWVPDLNLYKCRRQSGRFASYVAVATWRPSTQGHALEQRALNLKISGKGIKDWGTGEGFSPINLVMRARQCARADAVGWLQERLCQKGPEVDFEALLGVKAKKEETPNGATGAAPAKENDSKGDGGGEAPNEGKERARTKKPRFNFEMFDEIQVGKELPYLVEELIPLKGIVVVWGKPKSLKSFLLLGLCYHVVNGWPFHGRAVKQGCAVYCAFEGGHGYTKRVEALRRHHGYDEGIPFAMLRGGANLIGEHKALIQELRAKLESKIPEPKNRVPVVVVLDTLNRSLHGSENNPQDMAEYFRAAEAVRNAFDCVVIIVHHCGWDESRPRGHSSLQGAVDAELAVTPEGDMVCTELMLAREGPEGGRIIGRRKQIIVGEDPNGKALTSLVIEPVDDAVPGSKPIKHNVAWPGSLKVFRAAFVEALLGFGVAHKIPDGPTVKAVDLDHVSDAFARTYTVKGREGSTAEQIKESRTLAFSRALERAQQRGLITGWVDGARQIIWPTSPFEGEGGYAV
jgi:hypothetical protein